MANLHAAPLAHPHLETRHSRAHCLCFGTLPPGLCSRVACALSLHAEGRAHGGGGVAHCRWRGWRRRGILVPCGTRKSGCCMSGGDRERGVEVGRGGGRAATRRGHKSGDTVAGSRAIVTWGLMQAPVSPCSCVVESWRRYSGVACSHDVGTNVGAGVALFVRHGLVAMLRPQQGSRAVVAMLRLQRGRVQS